MSVPDNWLGEQGVQDNAYWRKVNENGVSVPFTLQSVNSDWHDTFSVQLGELMEGGFNPFGDPAWPGMEWFNAEQRQRFEQKFEYRYRYWEIGVTPPGVWREMLTSRMMEVLPKYKPLYQALADGTSLLQTSDEYSKHRSVYSDFPQTQLNQDGAQDYANSGTDTQWETVGVGDWLHKIREVQDYRDLDAMLLDETKGLFTWLTSSSTPW